MMHLVATRPVEPFLAARFKGRLGKLAVESSFSLTQRWTVLFGPSGAGKSTLLHALCGLTSLHEQRVICDDTDLTSTPVHLRRFALVTQQPTLLPHLSARENVLFSLASRKDVQSHRRTIEANRLLEKFHASAFADKRPRVLSGGEQQRVALARAAASRPRLLLLDEALTGLSQDLRAEIVSELKSWIADTGMSILSVTHDVGEVLEYGQEVLRMGNGRIIQQGEPMQILAAERTALLLKLS